MEIGDTIKKMRKKNGMTQEDLSKVSGVTQTYISQIESGRRKPTLKILELLCDSINVPFPIIAFLSLDVNSIPENKRETFRIIQPAINAMIQEYFTL